MWKTCRPLLLSQFKHQRLLVSAFKRNTPINERYAIANTIVVPTVRNPMEHLTSFYSTSTNDWKQVNKTLDDVVNIHWGDINKEIHYEEKIHLGKAFYEEFMSKCKLIDDHDTGNARELSAHLANNYLTAGYKLRHTQLIIKAFEYLQKFYPMKLKVHNYHNYFDFLASPIFKRYVKHYQRINALEKVYLRAKEIYTSGEIPGHIYRFGIVSSIFKRDVDSAEKLFHELEAQANTVPSSTVLSFMLYAYTITMDHTKAMAMYEKIMRSDSNWTQESVVRVLRALKQFKEPQKAFEFYSYSNTALTSMILSNLLEISRYNKLKDEAIGILDNRKQFDIRMDTQTYNDILETLIFLKNPEGMLEIMEEMRERNIPWSPNTVKFFEIYHSDNPDVKNAIMDFHKQEYRPKDKRNDKYKHSSDPTKKSIADEINSLIDKKDIKAATASIEKHEVPLELSTHHDEMLSNIPGDYQAKAIEIGALYVPTYLANIATRVHLAAIAANIDHDVHKKKLIQLAHGYGLLKRKYYPHALRKIVKITKDSEVSYAALKGLQAHNFTLTHPTSAATIFREFKDLEALELLVDNLVKSKNTGAEANEDTKNDMDNSAFVRPFNYNHLFKLLVATAVETGDLVTVRRIISKVKNYDILEAKSGHNLSLYYNTALLHMRKTHSYSYKSMHDKLIVSFDVQPDGFLPQEFYSIWQDVLSSGVYVSRQLLSNVVLALATGNSKYKSSLLDMYTNKAVAEAKHRNDTYKLQDTMYHVLLTIASTNGTIEQLENIYEESLSNFAKRNEMSKNERVEKIPRPWISLIVYTYANAGEWAKAYDMVTSMIEKTGGTTFKAMFKTLEACTRAGQIDKVRDLLQILKTREFELKSYDANKLIHAATIANSPELILEIVQAWEKLRPTVNSTDLGLEFRQQVFHCALESCANLPNAEEIMQQIAALHESVDSNSTLKSAIDE